MIVEFQHFFISVGINDHILLAREVSDSVPYRTVSMTVYSSTFKTLPKGSSAKFRMKFVSINSYQSYQNSYAKLKSYE